MSVIGQVASHYKILERLGGGGMGVVYKAQDLKLDRPVALKFLPSDLTRDTETKERFVHEAKAASSLQHANICVVHDIDETSDMSGQGGAPAGTQMFICMEYLEGETLRKKIEQGPLTTEEAIDVALQVARGLTKAHENGIIHRDIKPANIMVTTDGVAKIVDFGLAKLHGQTSVTRAGSTIGTASYMSPEQARGETVDHRTDIWSLGVVLYEMLTGRRPFESDYESAVIYRIINEEPVPPQQLQPGIPAALEAIVLKTLRKDPQERYQRMQDLAEDLRRPDDHPIRFRRPRRKSLLIGAIAAVVLALASAGVYMMLPRGEAFTSVAVLPFGNPGGNAELNYLCDGLSESLINSLSRLPDLKVKSLSSVMRYKDKQVDARAVAQELGVGAVVTGNATLRGDSLSIAMELVDAQDNSHLWGDRWQSSLPNVLSFQREIARAVPEGLRLRLSRADRARLTRGYSSSKEAYLLYLKGRFYWNRRTPGDIRKAIEHFDKALSVDPSYALAYTGLADCYNLLGSMQYAVLPPSAAMPKARKAAERALEIDEELAEAHVSLGHVKLFFDWDLKAAESEFKRAIDLNPNYATAHQWYGDCLMLQNRRDEALAEKRKASELDPLSLVITMDLGTAQYYWRDYDAAIEQCRKTLEMDPTFLMARMLLARTYVQKKMYSQAVAEFTAIRNAMPAMTLPSALLGHALGMTGHDAEAKNVLRELTEASKQKYVPAHEMSAVCLGLGQKQEALQWLRKAFEERSGLMIYLRLEPALDPLRPEPAFAELVRDVEASTH